MQPRCTLPFFSLVLPLRVTIGTCEKGVGPGPVVRDGYNRILLATLSESVVHLRLEMITELLIGNVCGGNRHEYRVLALNLADPVKEDAIVLAGTEDFCTQGPCPVRR